MNQNVFRLTLPILFGYIPLGMAFGVLFTTQLDYAWWVAPLMGLVRLALSCSAVVGHTPPAASPAPKPV